MQARLPPIDAGTGGGPTACGVFADNRGLQRPHLICTTFTTNILNMRIPMKRLFLVAALTAPLSAPAQECPAIENDLDRLACYDRESGRTPTTETTTVPNGAWSVREEKSDFKDTTDVNLRLQSDAPITCSSYKQPAPATLILRCMENTTTLYIATQCHLASGHGGYGRVEYRVDTRKAKTRSFDASTDNAALGLWNGGRSIPMIKELIGAEKLLTRFTPYGESPVTASFNLNGLDEAIKPLRKSCHW